MSTDPVDEDNIAISNSGNNPTKTKWHHKGLGNGLILRLKNDEKYSYLVRMNIQGKDKKIPIGNVSEIQEHEAREEAKKIRGEINRKKRKANLAQTKSMVKATKSVREETPCFKNYNDAIQFIEELEKKVSNISLLPQNSPYQGKLLEMEETYAMIWLALLTPLNIDELLQANFKFIPNDYGTGIHLIILGKSGPFYLPLPSMAIETINRLKSRQPRGNEKIFPHLSALDKKTELGKVIKLAIEAIWTAYTINPNELVLFFKHIANRYSCYKSEFIESFVKKQHGNDQWRVFPHETRLLSNWWEECIKDRRFGFKPFKP